MNMIRKTAAVMLAALLTALSLTACKTTIKLGDDGLYDDRHDIAYINASTVYEATGRGEEYGVLKITDKESYDLFVIPGVDPTDMVATEDNNIVYASNIKLPTLAEMKPTSLHICVEGATMAHALHSITDQTAIDSIVRAFSENESIPYPGTVPYKNYRVRFESPDYPGFYYTLTYVEYAEDLEVDGESMGKYFLRSSFERIFIPVGDEIHTAMNGRDTSTTETQAETTAHSAE